MPVTWLLEWIEKWGFGEQTSPQRGGRRELGTQAELGELSVWAHKWENISPVLD